MQRDRSGEVMASVDETAGPAEYVIADVSRDGAWLSIRSVEAPELARWR